MSLAILDTTILSNFAHAQRPELIHTALGESATTAAAAATRQARFFSDDLAARRLAQAKGLPVSGTIGLLLALVRREVVTLAEGDGLLATMTRQGYRSPAVTLRVYLEEG